MKVELSDDVANYLFNQKRGDLLRLEKSYGLKIQILGQPGLPVQQFNVDFSRGALSSRVEKVHPEKGIPPQPERGEERVTPDEADRLAIEELKKETKESLLKKFLWPPSLWRGIRKPAPPPHPPHLHPRLVPFQGVAQRALHLLVVLSFVHVDEVDDHQTSQVA